MSDTVPIPVAVASPAAVRSRPQKYKIVGEHYKMGKKIGEGSFGVIHEGTNFTSLLMFNSFSFYYNSSHDSRAFFPEIPLLVISCSINEHIGINLLTNQYIAVKLELAKTNDPQLHDEFRIYRHLAGTSK